MLVERTTFSSIEQYFAWAEARIAFAREYPGFFDKKQKQTKKRPAKPKQTAKQESLF